MEVRNQTRLLHGFKLCSRRPPQPEMMFVVRGKYALPGLALGAAEPGEPVRLFRSSVVSDASIEAAAAAGETVKQQILDASVQLGQWSLTADTYEEGDEGRIGAPLYPGDFADAKLNAEVMLKGACFAPRGATECDVTFAVGDWEKTLKVVGHRVRTDEVAGGAASAPKPIGKLAVDYAHAFGGPGFDANPVGKGFVRDAGDGEEELYQPPRSQRSQVMPAQQLANVLYADGAEVRDGLPAGFGPLNPAWPHRARHLGTKYDEAWRKSRAPFFAEDFDFRYFHCAPPDQQLKGFLRGDEKVRFSYLHPARRNLTVTLPAVRVRVMVQDDQDDVREIPMVLDTLFADLDEGALYLTWRGHTRVREEDLEDVAFALVTTEPLAGPKRSRQELEDELRAFAADPIGMADAFPEGFLEHAEAMEQLEEANDEQIDRLVEEAMASDDPGGPLGWASKKIAPPTIHEQLDLGAASTREAGEKMGDEKLRAKIRELFEDIGRSGPSPLVLPLEEGEEPRVVAAPYVRETERQLHARRRLIDDAEQQAAIDAAIERIQQSPLAAADPSYTFYDPADGEDEPGPGANLAGRDLSRMDLRGVDLRGANLEGADLSRARLDGVRLDGSSLVAASLHKTSLVEAHLDGANLSQATLHRVDARGASFRRVKLVMTRITSSDLTAAHFDEATGRMAVWSKSTLDRATAAGMVLHKCRFDECRLEDTDFGAAEIHGSELRKCEAPRLRLIDAELPGTAFHESGLEGAKVAGARGEGCVWMKSRLHRADFTGVDMPLSFFVGSDFTGATFHRANLEAGRFDRANLKEVDFSGAKLSGAVLRRTLLSRSRWSKATLYDAKVLQAAGTGVQWDGARLDRCIFDRSEITR